MPRRVPAGATLVPCEVSQDEKGEETILSEKTGNDYWDQILDAMMEKMNVEMFLFKTE